MAEMFQMTVDAAALKLLARRMAREGDGKALRQDLVRQLKDAAEIVSNDIRQGVTATPSKGHKGASLRAAIARSVYTQVRTGGYTAGVRITTRQGKFVRGFTSAPERYDSPKGWRHPVYGHRDRWARNEGHPFWNKAAAKNHDVAREKCLKAMEDMALRVVGRGG